MKNNKLFSVLIVFILINTNLFSQDFCEEGVHGIKRHIHLHCTGDILITSLIDDGDTGTVVSGIITTTGTIFIKPGATFVRIIPVESGRPHATKVGGENDSNQGGYGRETLNTHATLHENIKIYPNPIENDITLTTEKEKIIGYELLSFYGKSIKKQKLTPTSANTFSLIGIPKGMYILKINLNTGKQEIKTIIKK